MATEKKALVFVSSTSELEEERRAVETALPWEIDCYRYENDAASGKSAQERLESILESTDVFVAILGARYGSLLPADQKERAIVEWEFDTAYARRDQVEILAFPKEYPEDDAVEERQRAFIQRLESFHPGLWIKRFASVAQLQFEFQRAMIKWMSQFLDRSFELDAKMDEMHGRRSRLVRWGVVTTLLIGLFAVASLLAMNLILMPAAVMACALIGIVIAACMMLIDH